ncbi:DNA-binding protein HEXBP-like [Danaus plexippus]|uniref:DNA-binding protein HEXBP-like n=1 Tax=Danaus plexippus TaxID=13037 RepID=UPI002AB1E9EB|nr:DNA-binding protein HEXBP-like [Danaus plexippus]
MRVPVAAAKKLTSSGRLMVGWVSARVVLLAARPKRCFRCLDTGHVAAKCRHPEDRSRTCFRCGTSGHKAAECEAAPNCFLCEAAGKSERAHVLGASGCVARPSPPGTTAATTRRTPRKAQPKKPKANGGGGAVSAPPAMELDA